MALAFHPDFEYVLATDEQGDTYIVAEELLRQRDARDRLQLRRRTPGRFPARRSKAPNFSIRFSIAWCRACSASTSRWSRAAASCTPLRATARKTFAVGQEYGLRDLRAARRRRPLHGRFAGVQGQDGLRGQSRRHRPAEVARRAGRRRQTPAQLSALLALPQPGDFPRHRAMVRAAG